MAAGVYLMFDKVVTDYIASQDGLSLDKAEELDEYLCDFYRAHPMERPGGGMHIWEFELVAALKAREAGKTLTETWNAICEYRVLFYRYGGSTSVVTTETDIWGFTTETHHKEYAGGRYWYIAGGSPGELNRFIAGDCALEEVEDSLRFAHWQRNNGLVKAARTQRA